MSPTRFSLILISFVTALATLAALAQEEAPERREGVLEIRQAANEAYREEDYAAYRRAVYKLHRLRPYNGEYMAQVVLANALVGDRPGALSMMLRMQQQGLSYDFDEFDDSRSLRDTEAYAYINDLMVRAGRPSGEAELLFELPADLVLPTSIAWDESRQTFLIANALDGAVFSVDREGNVRELLRANEDNGLWGIYGLLVAPGENRLWLASSADQNFRGFDPIDAGRSALLEFELDSLEFVKRYPVPVDGRPHRLGDLVRTPSGDIYAIDTMFPIVYRLGQGYERLQPFVASADMVSLRSAALSQDGRMLYIADYELGIMAIDLVAKSALKVVAPETVNLGGIDGMEFWDGKLVIIQSGNRPHRIMRLTLGSDGISITDVAPLAVAQPFFEYPSFGTVVGDELYFLANSHWVRTLQDPVPIRVARTNIANPPDLVDPALQKFWDEHEAIQGISNPDHGEPAPEGGP